MNIINPNKWIKNMMLNKTKMTIHKLKKKEKCFVTNHHIY